MTPDPVVNPIEEPKSQPPSTVGLTTKVVKGSMWTLVGSVLPLAVSFISTPFIIRFLGAESYGVLLLVGLIPMYFSFADFGMGIASTRFASEAFGQDDPEKESQVVWTAVTVAAVSSIVVALPIFLFSRLIVTALNVPEHLIGQASVALKITSAAFVLGIVASVVNSPMLARLRMDLNTVTNALPKILLVAVTPVILYYGGGIVGAVSWGLIVNVAILAVVFYFSGRLLPTLLSPAFRREHLRPLLKFGSGWLVASVAIILLSGLEKFFLTSMVSVEALAYYSVAFTLASVTTTLPLAITQSLLPAFSQLLEPDKHEQFSQLFFRTVRMNIVWLFPALMIAFVVAKPFISFWAGVDFGLQSTVPFYILLAGLCFNIVAYVPYVALIAAGKTASLGKLYVIELVVYSVVATFLISRYGVVGAAIAWSARVIFEGVVLFAMARSSLGLDAESFGRVGVATIGGGVLLPPVVLTLFFPGSLGLLAGVALTCLAIYLYLAWKRIVTSDERKWLAERLFAFIKQFSKA